MLNKAYAVIVSILYLGLLPVAVSLLFGVDNIFKGRLPIVVNTWEFPNATQAGQSLCCVLLYNQIAYFTRFYKTYCSFFGSTAHALCCPASACPSFLTYCRERNSYSFRI